MPASGIIPLSGDKELTAVPVSRLLAQGLGGSIKLAQLGTAAGAQHSSGAQQSSSGAQQRTEPAAATPAVVKVEQVNGSLLVGSGVVRKWAGVWRICGKSGE